MGEEQRNAFVVDIGDLGSGAIEFDNVEILTLAQSFVSATTSHAGRNSPRR